jgi:hypothetical protein
VEEKNRKVKAKRKSKNRKAGKNDSLTVGARGFYPAKGHRPLFSSVSVVTFTLCVCLAASAGARSHPRTCMCSGVWVCVEGWRGETSQWEYKTRRIHNTETKAMRARAACAA